MSRLIDADALERDGWRMSRTVQIDEKTMELQTRKPTDFPAVEPERIRGRWVKDEEASNLHVEPIYICSACNNMDAWGEAEKYTFKFCPNCGADMREDEQNG